MSFASIGVTGDYSQSNTCSNGLRAGYSCTIKVTFTPTQTGTRTGTVTISDSGAGSLDEAELRWNKVDPRHSDGIAVLDARVRRILEGRARPAFGPFGI